MSWSDIFFPGNEKRRMEVVRMCTRISTYMEMDFDATNHLSDMINEHMEPVPKLQHIQVDYDVDVDTNASKLIKQMEKIQKIIEEVDKELAEKLEPEAYRKLMDEFTPYKEKLSIAKKAISGGLATVGTVAGIYVATKIYSGAILTSLTRVTGRLIGSAIGTIAVGVLTMGLDMIAGAIVGAVEKNKLEAAIDELEVAEKNFVPASQDYYRTIIQVQERLGILIEMGEI